MKYKKEYDCSIIEFSSHKYNDEEISELSDLSITFKEKIINGHFIKRQTIIFTNKYEKEIRDFYFNLFKKLKKDG